MRIPSLFPQRDKRTNFFATYQGCKSPTFPTFCHFASYILPLCVLHSATLRPTFRCIVSPVLVALLEKVLEIHFGAGDLTPGHACDEIACLLLPLGGCPFSYCCTTHHAG
jgi:hypothetical protein